MPPTENNKILMYILAKKDPALAVAEFMRQMERKHQDMMKTVSSEMKKELLNELRNMPISEIIAKMNIAKGERGEKGEKGEKGDNPIVGMDYPAPKDGLPGVTPLKGIDYFTKKEIENIITTVQSSIIIPEPKNGMTPIAGVDYPSYEEITKMVSAEAAKWPKYDENSILEKIKATYPKLEIKGEEVVKLINALPIRSELQIDAEHIKNLPRMVQAQTKKSIGRAGGGGDLVYSYPITSDGTKTYSVPYNRKSIGLFQNDTPPILTEGDGFSITVARTSITMLCDNAPQIGSVLNFIYVV
jgi:hypothetical protein